MKDEKTAFLFGNARRAAAGLNTETDFRVASTIRVLEKCRAIISFVIAASRRRVVCAKWLRRVTGTKSVEKLPDVR